MGDKIVVKVLIGDDEDMELHALMIQTGKRQRAKTLRSLARVGLKYALGRCEEQSVAQSVSGKNAEVGNLVSDQSILPSGVDGLDGWDDL